MTVIMSATAEALTLGSAQLTPWAACQVGNGNAVGDQLSVVTAPWGGKAWETAVRPGDLTNGAKGRCELLYGGPDENSSTILNWTEEETLYFGMRKYFPTGWSAPADPNDFQIKPCAPLNGRALPCFTMKSTYGDRWRVGTNGGEYLAAGPGENPNQVGGPVAGKTATANWNLASGTLVPGKYQDLAIKIKLSAGYTAATAKGEVEIRQRKEGATTWTVIHEATGLTIGYKEATVAMPSHYARCGLYCDIHATITYAPLVDNFVIGTTWEDVTGTAATATPSSSFVGQWTAHETFDPTTATTGTAFLGEWTPPELFDPVQEVRDTRGTRNTLLTRTPGRLRTGTGLRRGTGGGGI